MTTRISLIYDMSFIENILITQIQQTKKNGLLVFSAFDYYQENFKKISLHQTTLLTLFSQ